jgi:hypothetical protein
MGSSRLWEYFKGHVFWSLSVVLLGVIIGLDVTDIQDPCLIFYGLQWAISLICGVLFWSYLKCRRGSSKIYWWLTILLFAIAIDAGIMFAARYYLIYKGVVYATLVNSTLWNYRPIFKVMALMYLLWFAVKQRYGKGGTYHDLARQGDMDNGFAKLEARILAGEIRFKEHTDLGMVLEAELIIKAKTNGE